MDPLRVLNICAEFAPLAKSGGLADVTSALTRFLAGQGHELVTLMPRYAAIKADTPMHDPVLGPRTAEIGGTELRYAGCELAGTHEHGRVYLLNCPDLYGDDHIYGDGEREVHRFGLLCRAALELCQALEWSPDIVHCHDWHTALVPAMIRTAQSTDRLFAATCTVLTIHNIGYQGIFPVRVLGEAGLEDLFPLFDAKDLARDRVNLLKTGILHADALTTVSPTHAREIRSPEYGMGLDELLTRKGHRLHGILNGVDYAHWNPETDPLIARNYHSDTLADKYENRRALIRALDLELEPDAPLVGMVSRLVSQKGCDLLAEVLPDLLADHGLGCTVLGTGDAAYATALRQLAHRFPRRLAFIEGHDEPLAHQIFAGCDLLAVPSRYEPCGLTQMYALRYGTVPVVRKTGGLADTVRHFDPRTGRGNGSVFEHADASGLRWGLTVAIEWFAQPETWHRLMRNGMAEDFSWQHQGRHYENLYRTLVGASRP